MWQTGHGTDLAQFTQESFHRPGDVNRKFRLSNQSYMMEANRSDWSNQSNQIDVIDRTIETNRISTSCLCLIEFDWLGRSLWLSLIEFDCIRSIWQSKFLNLCWILHVNQRILYEQPIDTPRTPPHKCTGVYGRLLFTRFFCWIFSSVVVII